MSFYRTMDKALLGALNAWARLRGLAEAPRQVIGKELPLPLMERYPLALFERLRGWPFVRVTLPRDALDRDRAKLVLHRIMRGDDRQKGIHSHPWYFGSVTFGPYVEQVLARGKNPEIRTHRRAPGSVAVHGPSYEHIVIEAGADGAPCWTLAFLGPRVAPWGFPFVGEIKRGGGS